jgi:hypothetical protein
MRFVWVLAGVGTMVAAAAWPAGTDAGSAVAAVWKEQHLSFLYRGRTSRYSCDGLRDKVRAMLLDLGARRDLAVSASSCGESAPQARLDSASAILNIVFFAPALPGAAAKPPRPADLGPVEASFEPFTLTSDAFRNMGDADCELVEEFVHQILPTLVTRNLQQDISCVPMRESGSRFLVRGEVLHIRPGR